MPADTNPSGDIFGGWLMSMMDMAGANVSSQRAAGRVTTVAVDKIEFHRPVHVGDVVSCYAEVIHVLSSCMGPDSSIVLYGGLAKDGSYSGQLLTHLPP